MRVYDIRRSEYLSGKVSKKTFENLTRKVEEFIITSSKKKRNADKGLNR
jgi:hypothetical protein